MADWLAGLCRWSDDLYAQWCFPGQFGHDSGCGQYLVNNVIVDTGRLYQILAQSCLAAQDIEGELLCGQGVYQCSFDVQLSEETVDLHWVNLLNHQDCCISRTISSTGLALCQDHQVCRIIKSERPSSVQDHQNQIAILAGP